MPGTNGIIYDHSELGTTPGGVEFLLFGETRVGISVCKLSLGQIINIDEYIQEDTIRETVYETALDYITEGKADEFYELLDVLARCWMYDPFFSCLHKQVNEH